MIFVTVGTAQFPFDRLLKSLDEGIKKGEIKDKIFAQIGYSRYQPRNFVWGKFFSYDEFVENLKKAKLVIAHGGVGTMILCLSLEKDFIVFPRKKTYGEHVDDHQVEFIKMIEEKEKITVAYNKKQLMEKIKAYEIKSKKKYSIKESPEKKNLLKFLSEIK